MDLLWWSILVSVAFALVLWWFLRPSRRAARERAKQLPLEDQPEDRPRGAEAGREASDDTR